MKSFGIIGAIIRFVNNFEIIKDFICLWDYLVHFKRKFGCV